MFFMKTEFEFINNLREKHSLNKIGDDCAVLPKDSKTDLVITTDLLIEDIDFKIEWTKPEFLGHKALAVSLSDVAAMGAKPVWSMLSIGIPEEVWKTDFVEKFYDGYMNLAEKFEVELVGGDVSRSPDKIVIDSIVAGETKKGKAVLRSTAKKGELIFVTGSLGGAGAGLKLLEMKKTFGNPFEENLILRQLKPHPQTKTGQFIGENNIATAMIDISDGLSSDLAHLCRESQIGAKLFAKNIPVDKDLSGFVGREVSEKLRVFDMDLSTVPFCPISLPDILNGGEDFELLLTVKPKVFFQYKNEFRKSQPFTYRKNNRKY